MRNTHMANIDNSAAINKSLSVIIEYNFEFPCRRQNECDMDFVCACVDYHCWMSRWKALLQHSN